MKHVTDILPKRLGLGLSRRSGNANGPSEVLLKAASEDTATVLAGLRTELTGLAIMAIGIWLPFSPFATALGFAGLPALYWPLIVTTLFLYVVLTQAVKMWLLKKAWI